MPLRPRTGWFLGGTLFFGLVILGPAGAAVAANGQVCMGVVIDDGPHSTDANWQPVAVQGPQVASGTSDLDALAAANDTATQNNSGLVCAINNFPADGLQNCLSSNGGQYYYWSYWEGNPYTNTWTYANVGPASHTVSSGQTYVEGWSFQDPGPDNQNAAKPSVTPATAFAQACPGVQPVPAGGSGGGGGGDGSGGGGNGSSGGDSSPGISGQSSATTTTAFAGAGSGAPRTAAGGPTSSGVGATTTTHPGAGVSSPPGGTHSTSTTAPAGNAAHHGGGKATLADARPHGSSGGGDPALPIVIVASVIVLLGGAAWWRWRRRPLEE